MKAVILELRNGYASVLSDDGCIRKIKDNSYVVGQVISMTIVRNSMIKKITMLAASAAAVLVLSIGSWAYLSPFSYVSLDVNPSIEFVLNRFDRVLRIKAVNKDGENILKELKSDALKNKTITNAINLTLTQVSELGYLSNDRAGGIVIAASNKSSKKADELVREIKTDVENEISESYESTILEIYSVGMERVKEAQKLGVTPGKLNLVDKLIESSADPHSVVVEEWLEKPVKDIMKATKENKTAEETSSSSTSEDSIDGDHLQVDSNDKKSVKDVVKEARKFAKAAEKAAREAEREAKKIAKEAEKEAKKAAKNAEKEAKKDGRKTNNKYNENQDINETSREYIEATEEAARDAREAAKNARDAVKKAEKAERKAKDAKKDKDDTSKREAEKEAKKAAREAEKAAEDAIREAEKTKPNQATNNSHKNGKNHNNNENHKKAGDKEKNINNSSVNKGDSKSNNSSKNKAP